MNCTHCNSPLAPDATVCSVCGTPVQQSSHEHEIVPQQTPGFDVNAAKNKDSSQAKKVLSTVQSSPYYSKFKSSLYYPQIKKYGIFVVVGFFVLIICMCSFTACGKKGKKEFEEGKKAYEIQNYRKAATSFMESAQKGNDEAQYYLGLCFSKGLGVETDWVKAAKWFQESAEGGNPDAMYKIGECLKYGKGVSEDFDRAAKWFQKAADKGNRDAMRALGHYYISKKEQKKGVKWYQKAAEKGDAPSMYAFANYLFNGNGVKKNIKEAIKWSRMATESDPTFSEARTQLKNYTSMQKWIEDANKGDLEAARLLGYNYITSNNLDIDKDTDEGLKWYRKAADKGMIKAMLDMGFIYQGRWGVVDKKYYDQKEAAKWFRKVAEGGVVEKGKELEYRQYREDGINGLIELSNKGCKEAQTALDELTKKYRKAAEGGDQSGVDGLKILARKGHKDAQNILDEREK